MFIYPKFYEACTSIQRWALRERRHFVIKYYEAMFFKSQQKRKTLMLSDRIATYGKHMGSDGKKLMLTGNFFIIQQAHVQRR